MNIKFCQTSVPLDVKVSDRHVCQISKEFYHLFGDWFPFSSPSRATPRRSSISHVGGKFDCNSQLLESHSPQLGSKVGEENNPQTPFLFSLALIFLERHCLSLTCANSNLSVNFYYRALCIPMTQEGSICPVVSSDIVCVG